LVPSPNSLDIKCINSEAKMLHTLTLLIHFLQFTGDDEKLAVTQHNKIFSSDIGIASGWLK